MTNRDTKINFSDSLVASFVDHGVTDAFLVTGGAIAPFTGSLIRNGQIQMHYMLTEQSAAAAAEAFGFYDGKPALLVVTSGPGVTNALTGVAAAWANSAPIIVVSGQARSIDVIESQNSECREVGSQHVRTDLLAGPMVKLFIEPLTTIDSDQLVSNLYKSATGDRMGPVWLSLPQDIQRSFEVGQELETVYVNSAPDLDRRDIALVVEMLKAAERPAFLLGNGSRAAIQIFLSIAQKFDAAILTTWPGLDLIDEEHELYVGRPGGIPSSWTPNLVNENADVLVIVGARLDLGQVAYNPQLFAKNAQVFRVDIDSNEFSRIPERLTWRNILSTSAKFAIALEEAASDVEVLSHDSWWKEIRQWDQDHARAGDVPQDFADGVSTYLVVNELSAAYAEKDIATGSSGTCIEMVLQAWKSSPSQRVINSCGLGSMGFGIATAVGVAMKNPGHNVLCIESDGSAVMNLQDLQTVWSGNLPIHVVILDSRGYKSINLSQGRLQEVSHGNDIHTGLYLPNLGVISEAIGIPTKRISQESELRGGITWLQSNAGPALLQIQVSATEEALPRLVSKVNAQGRMETPPMSQLFPE